MNNDSLLWCLIRTYDQLFQVSCLDSDSDLLKDSVLCNQWPYWIQRVIYTICQPGKRALYVFGAVLFPLVFCVPHLSDTPFCHHCFNYSPGVIRAHRPYVFCVASIGASVPRVHMWQQQTLGFSWVVGRFRFVCLYCPWLILYLLWDLSSMLVLLVGSQDVFKMLSLFDNCLRLLSLAK